MKDNIAIKVENLTKTYKLYNSPSDRMKEALHWKGKKYHRDFFALNDVSFEIQKGECVGILGKNGAGKSTILKIITGVLNPTSGNIKVEGRISALLELGAGFNPEYTGMENIYFQGNLMGFAPEVMRDKMDDILKFAEIGEFINQPVKIYSSGMFARLAFAVAINIEPDILIVDEALAVGDAGFQNKCLRKMTQIIENGSTVLFVSHDTQAINIFCTRAIWLKDGYKHMDGSTKDVTDAYKSFSLYGLENITPVNLADSNNKKMVSMKSDLNWLINTQNLEFFGEGKAKILRAGFLNDIGKATSTLIQGSKAKFICEMEGYEDLYNVGIGVMFKNHLNLEIITFNSYMYDNPLPHMKKNHKYLVTIDFVVPKIFPREYIVTVALSDGTQDSHNQQHWIYALTTISIISKDLVDACMVSLYKDEVNYHYEQI